MTVDELLHALYVLERKQPNAAQRAVMQHNGGPLWVIAGPGTGKTYALILRCLRLLCVDSVPPEAIVLTTFSRKVAEELKQQLQEKLLQLKEDFPDVGDIDLAKMHLGTLHSLCWDILTQTPGSAYRNLDSLDGLDQAFFVYQRSRFCKPESQWEDLEAQEYRQLFAWAGKPSSKFSLRWERARAFVEMYERLIDNRVDRDRFAAAAPHFSRLNQLVSEYETELLIRSFTNQALLQQQALEILLHTPQGQKLAANILHVIVDEYQDTNPLQSAIYRALANNAPHNLCSVGDDDQALYRFRGGTVGCMVQFAQECQQAWPECTVEQVALTENYRSQPPIVEWLNGFILAHPAMRQPNARVSGKPPLHAQPPEHPDAPAVHVLRGKETPQVARSLARLLRELREKAVIESYNQCALLAYSVKSSQFEKYRKALQDQSISLSSLSAPREDPVYQQLLGTLLVALDPNASALPPNYHHTSFVNKCRAWAKGDAALPALVTMAKEIHAWLVKDPVAAKRMSLTTLAKYVLNAPPITQAIEQKKEAWLVAQTLLQTLDSYDRVVERGANHFGIPVEDGPTGRKRIKKKWLEGLYYVLIGALQVDHFLREKEIQLQGALTQASADAVQALTIHSAKGLQFPIVCVVVDDRAEATPDGTHRMEQELFSFRQDIPADANPTQFLGGTMKERALQDAVRLHYVAYSRAEQLLLLLVPDDRLDPLTAIGLGPDATWFYAQFAAVAQKGVVQYELPWG